VRVWMEVICLSFAIGFGGQKDASDPVQRPTTGPLDITPTKIDFGSQPAGTTSPARTATLANHSNQNVNIRDVAASGIDFLETDTCQGTLAAGAHCTIDVTFTPAVTGLRLGTVLITTDSPSPIFLVLMGSGE